MTDKTVTTPPAGNYDVLIRRNADGLGRVRRIDWNWNKNGEGGDMYWWTDGNFGCDCNREWEFQRAGGEPISDDPVCGGSRYTVVKIILPDGEEIPVDQREDA